MAQLPDNEASAYAILERAALAQQPCPTNFDLAAQLDCNPKTAIQLVARLKDKGMIAVEPTTHGRVVEIVARGIRTAPTVTKRRVVREREDYIVRRPAAILTSHTPCFRCGARPDACACSYRRAMS